ncbi:MAG: 4-vinyl reductase [Planctomycetes bacterium]|nr:4-vinyl reductase [Planctomycetota bacterium]
MDSHDKQRKYAFSWELIEGELPTDESRPTLGNVTTLEVYRIFQFALRDVLEQRLDTEAADEIFREAGVVAGRAFFEKYCKEATDVSSLASIIQSRFKEMSIGIVRFEEVDLDNMTFQLTVDEDLDCSGLPDTSDQICVYDEGLIKGILDAFTGKNFSVKEVDCWCTGERTCRFRAQMHA